jgi:hypothetical protein
MPRGSKPGERRGGRQKGTPNKITQDLKAALEGAFNEVGGQAYLAQVARENPQVFCTLLGKILPNETKHSGAIAIPAGVDRPPRETREEWLKRKQDEHLRVVAAAGSAE